MVWAGRHHVLREKKRKRGKKEVNNFELGEWQGKLAKLFDPVWGPKRPSTGFGLSRGAGVVLGDHLCPPMANREVFRTGCLGPKPMRCNLA